MKKNESYIPLVVAFTPGYFIPAATCLYSLFENTGNKEYFHIICLISEDLSEKMKDNLRLIGGVHATYSFINLKGRMNDIYVDEKYTEAASYRLLLPELLPDLDKVMYIDCDIIVRNDLATLYRFTNLDGNYLAAVFEPTMDFQTEHLKTIGCDLDSYINSGFLILNLDQLRRDRMVEKFIDASKNDNLEFPDQDVLNILCRDRIVGLAPYYNSIRTFYLPQYKKSFLRKYSERDWEEVKRHGTVHYTGAKPWNNFTVEFKLWWQYYERLPAVLKKEWKENKKMYYFYKINSSAIGSALIDGLQSVYRKLKY